MAGQENNAENNQQQEQQQQQPQQQQQSNVAQEGPAASAETAASQTRPQRVTVHKIDYEPDVVYLYQFCRSPCSPSVSPFCLKVETWLRVAGIKYQVSYPIFFFWCFSKAYFLFDKKYNNRMLFSNLTTAAIMNTIYLLFGSYSLFDI